MGTIEKRGKNSWRIGAQIKVNNSWQWIRLSLRMDPALSEAAQRRQAERELLILEARLRGEVLDVPTLREWSETWLTKHLGPGTSPVTVSNYRFLLSSRILPALGDKLLTDLTPALLTDWLFNLRREKRKTTRKPDSELKHPRRKSEKLVSPSQLSQPLSAKTAQNYFGCLKTMLAAAVRVGLLDSNPMDRVQRPKKRRQKKTTLPEAELVALLRLILTEADTPLRLAVLLALLCSLRLGEIGALRYPQVDWSAGTITIDRALKYTPDTGAFIAETKTDAGDRVITLPPSMVRILRDTMWADVEEAQDDPDSWQGDYWIVHSRHGARVSKDTPSKWFRRFADAHGFRGITFHDLRHIHATYLLQHHADIQSVSSRMGHSDPSVTLKVYADAMPARDQDAAAMMDQLLLSSGAVPAVPSPDPRPADPAVLSS